MDFKQIEAFVAVVRNRSFSKAAEEMFLSQPTISSHINTLEKELNMQLIDRTRRQAIPTPEGQRLYSYAVTLLNTRDQALYSLQNYALNISGVVRICASSVPGKVLVPKLMAKFRQKYEDVRFVYTQMDSQSVMDGILRHEYEIGFVGTKKNNGLIYEPIMKDRMVLITPQEKKYEAAVRTGMSLKDLKGERMILRESGSGTRIAFEEALNKKGISIEELDVSAYINDTGTIIHMVESGLGVAVVSEAALEKNNPVNKYYVVELNDYHQERTIYMVNDGRITLSPTAETFRFFAETKGGKDD